MKKKLVLMLVLALATNMMYAQTAKDLFKEFSKAENAEQVTVSPFMMKFARLFTPKGEATKWMKRIQTVKVLDLEECTEKVKDAFTQKVQNMNAQGYEEMIRAKDEDGKMTILIKQDKEHIRELLIAQYGSGDCALILIRGKIKRDDLNQITAEVKGKHGSIRL